MEAKIAKVVLYKHGIASFERISNVDGNQNIKLNFKQEEMNDVLKSLTVVDTSGKGSISSISYDNSKSIAQRREESPFKMKSSTSILSIISELKGVEVSLNYEGKQINGTVVSTTEMNTDTGKIGYITLWHENALNLFTLNNITDFKVNDPKIQFQLNEAMNIQRESKIKGQKTLTIYASGEGKRLVNMAYFIEAPIWKVSYRIIIPERNEKSSNDDGDNDKDDDKEEFILQGWAIVDNITEESWENVKLTLISGEPHSCEVDLFNPIFKKSKTPEPEYHSVSRPMVQQQMLNNLNAPQQMMRNAPQQMMNSFAPQQMLPSAPIDNTSTKELGDLFQYDIVHPVTVASNQSALVPIVDKKIKGQRVALYNKEKHQLHPNSAILFTNTTELTLEGGPCSVIETGTFVGESLLKTIQKKETKFIEYATEISMDIWEKSSSSSKFYSCTISNTTLNISEKLRYITTYNLRNKSSKDIQVYIEHRFRKDCNRVDTPEPTNPKPITFCIYKTKSSAGSTDTFVVTEEKINVRTEVLTNINRARLNALISQGIDKNISDVIQSYISLREIATQKQQQINSIAASIKQIYDNHSRIRSNLSTLVSQGSSAESLRKKYIVEMEKDEVKLSQLEKSRKELEEEKTSLNEEAESILTRITC